MTSAVTTRPGAQRWTTILDGGRLRQLRRQHELSQEQLATHAGISLTTIRRLDLLTELRDVAAAQKADRSGLGAATLTRMS